MKLENKIIALTVIAIVSGIVMSMLFGAKGLAIGFLLVCYFLLGIFIVLEEILEKLTIIAKKGRKL